MSIQIAATVEEVRNQVKAWRKEGLTVGLVPTMGYLHEGHGSLIAKSVEQNDRTVVSVFVNPTQFGPNEDLEAYPRDLDRDAAFCQSLGAESDCVGLPMETSKFKTFTQADYDELFKGIVEGTIAIDNNSDPDKHPETPNVNVDWQ